LLHSLDRSNILLEKKKRKKKRERKRKKSKWMI
jgi:hypothetical protein